MIHPGYARKCTLTQCMEEWTDDQVPSGSWAEVGTWLGGTGRWLRDQMIRLGVANEKLYLYDTFAGLPEPSPEDLVGETHMSKGRFAGASLEEVEALFHGDEGVIVREGVFPSTVVHEGDETYALVHVDCDLYQGVLDSCEFYGQRMAKGGFIVFDDYQSFTTPGATKAVDEYAQRQGMNVGFNGQRDNKHSYQGWLSF